MTVRNNAQIGSVKCNICGGVASVHQIERGARKGALYTRGCECKINQSPGKPLQEYWRENTKPLPGYEHLFPAAGEKLPEFLRRQSGDGSKDHEITGDLPEMLRRQSGDGSQVNDQSDQSGPETGEPAPGVGFDQQNTGKKKSAAPAVIGGALILLTGFAAIVGLKR